ncbi:MAG: hypothetical protein ACK5YG_06275, partial [Alphaproteobacteria bacterium]
HGPMRRASTSYGAANNLNQYVTVGQGASPSVTLTHDANGNLTGEGTWTFAYDAENRLRTANLPALSCLLARPARCVVVVAYPPPFPPNRKFSARRTAV